MTSTASIFVVLGVVVAILAATAAWIRAAIAPGHRRADPPELLALRAKLHKAEQDKHAACYERNLVVALLAATVSEYALGWPTARGYDQHFKSWGNCLYIDHPELGQLSWHFHDSHAHLIDVLGLSQYPGKWDGRNKQQKNEAIEKWLTVSA